MDFQTMLGYGMGRAVFFLRGHDARPYRRAILHACGHFIGYDAQTEPSRGQYLFDIIQATGEPGFYAPRVRQMLLSPEEVEMPCQIFELVAVMARHGDAQARSALYDAFARGAAGHDDTGAEEIISLDGIEGYLRVVRAWIRFPLPEDQHWYDGYLIKRVEEKYGKSELEAAIARTGAVEPEVARYVARARERRTECESKRRRRTATPAPDYETLSARINDAGERARWPRWRRWAREATDDTLRRLADDLVAETDRDRLLKLLHLFREKPFPLDPLPLIGLARGRDADVATAARKALSHFASPQVRHLALEVISASDRLWEGVELLVNNYREGDFSLLAGVTTKRLSADQRHWVGFAVFDVLQANLAPDAAEVLSLLYEQEPCSLCRHRVVQHLRALCQLPDWLIQECRFDADLATRDLVAD